MKFLGFFEKAIADFGQDGFAVSSSVSLLYILQHVHCIYKRAFFFYNLIYFATICISLFCFIHTCNSLSLSLSLSHTNAHNKQLNEIYLGGISINRLFAYCKGGNFNIYIWAWFGYFNC